ncbi:Uncharacterised protein [Escherichia coli]|nr:Uncharacterised protein [Escherichia coli]
MKIVIAVTQHFREQRRLRTVRLTKNLVSEAMSHVQDLLQEWLRVSSTDIAGFGIDFGGSLFTGQKIAVFVIQATQWAGFTEYQRVRVCRIHQVANAVLIVQHDVAHHAVMNVIREHALNFWLREPEITAPCRQLCPEKHPGFTVGQGVRTGKNGIVHLRHSGADPGDHTGGRGQSCRNLVDLVNFGGLRQVDNLHASFIANQNGNHQNVKSGPFDQIHNVTGPDIGCSTDNDRYGGGHRNQRIACPAIQK